MATVTAAALPPPRILIVDDDLAILRTISRYLRDYTVEVADSVETAVAQVDQGSFDLLLVDHRLPDGVGEAIIAHLRKKRSSVPAIVMSGNLNAASLGRVAPSAANDYIEKPFVREALLDKIERQLSARRLRHEAASQRAELDALYARSERELEVASGLFTRMAARGDFDPATTRRLVLAAERLAGDFVFGAATPTGSYRWMLGDVTGHTLSSALVTLTLAALFYGPGIELPSIAALLAALERELRAALPASKFCVGAICELDRRTHRLEIWNGGGPDVLIRRAAGGVIAVASTSLPLAADRFAPADHVVVRYQVEPGDRIVAFSDGLTELRDRDGQLLGAARLAELVAADPADQIYARLIDCIPSPGSPHGRYEDDISLIEVVV